MAELRVEIQIFARKLGYQIADELCVPGARLRARAEHMSDFQPHYLAFALRLRADGQLFARAGERLGEDSALSYPRHDIAVAPEIVLHYQNAAAHHEPERVRLFALGHYYFALLISAAVRIEGFKQFGQLGFVYSEKERRRFYFFKIFRHIFITPLFLQQYFCPDATIINASGQEKTNFTLGGIFMKRRIIHIDEEKCNGCGACAAACHEGAIAMVNGKAKLMRDDYCDGLGDCLPACPTGAITFVEREAAAYNAEAVKENMMKKKLGGHHGGCPGSRLMTMNREENASSAQPAEMQSRLRQWPVQIKLVPVNAPYFDGAKLLIAADCTAYAYAAFHEKFIKNHITLVGCPKLDSVDYSEKLTEIIANNNIQSVTVVRMEVPCCGGLEHAAKTALQNSGKFIPWQVVTISTDGRILD